MIAMHQFLSGFFLLFSMMGCANDTSSLLVKVNSPNFIITLPANPTTGFQWTVLNLDKKLISLTGSQFEKPNTKLIGAGGQMHFSFTLNKASTYPASTEIVFQYARPWEKGSQTLKRFKINIIKSTGP